MCDNCDSSVEAIAPSSSKQDDIFFFNEPLAISTESIAEVAGFDPAEFQRGLKYASYDSAVYTALINAGMDAESAVAYIFNNMNLQMNIEIAKIQANASIEVSKNAVNALDKQTL